MDDLSNIAPKLSKIKKEQIFNVPANYFDEFPSRIQGKVQKKKNSKSFFYILKPQIAMALLIIGFGTITYFGYKSILSSNIQPIVEQNILPAEILEILEYNTSNFEENTFIENLIESDLIDEDITEEENELIQYLIDEGIDYSTLIALL